MTEAEWLACADPARMLAFHDGTKSLRKIQLHAVACCRRFLHHLTDPRFESVLAAAERQADGQLSEREFDAARDSAEAALREFGEEMRSSSLDGRVACTALSALEDPVMAVLGFSENVDPEERILQAALLRDVCGNPFRPVIFAPAWRTATVTGLAQAIYEERAFDRLPILADALEDAGCTNADILGHCRGGGQHVRGCWVVDLVLCKG